MIFQNIAELKNKMGIPAPDNYAEVLGYHSPGDGGGGNFYWDNNSSDNINDGTIFQVNGVQNGRWKRVYSGAINVKWFGAEGNGNIDDTGSLQNCLNYSDNIYIEKGDYKITGKLSVINKSLSILSSPDAYLNKKFTGDSLIIFKDCPVINFNVNIRSSLPDVLKFNDQGIWDNIPQFRVEGLEGSIFSFQQCAMINIHNCNISDVYGYTIFFFNDGFINFTETNIHDNCFVDSCIQTWGNENINIDRNMFSNIALIPDKFTVIKNGTELPQTFSETKYAWQFGQVLSIIGNSMQVTNNVFENVSGLSIGADHNTTGTNLKESKILISNNLFQADSDRLRGANPPGFIWIENHQSAKVTGNRFT